MPTKKTVKDVAEEVVEKKATKKKAAPAKKAEKKEATEKKATTAKKVKKEVPAAKTVKKETTKKKVVKKTAKAKVEDLDLKTVKDYEDAINWKKGEAKALDWLYIELSADALLTQFEAGKDNLKTVCQALYNCMLEGDYYIVEPTEDNCALGTVAVRFYCDNLSPERKKVSEINQ